MDRQGIANARTRCRERRLPVAVLAIFLYAQRPIFTAWTVLMMQNWIARMQNCMARTTRGDRATRQPRKAGKHPDRERPGSTS
jgi:hypothetical protein